jgi:hypothetical protein
VAAFPGHWAPNDMLIYTGTQFPEPYRDGALIAFHGSWNRAPREQAGYNVVFQPLANGKAAGGYVVFADVRRWAQPCRLKELMLTQGAPARIFQCRPAPRRTRLR